MNFWVIRHKPSGTLLPARLPATSYDFDRPEGTHEPRLFKSERAAKNCATCWSQGVWVRETVTETHGWEYAHLDFDYLAEQPEPQPVAGRKREDLEVLPVRLTFTRVVK